MSFDTSVVRTFQGHLVKPVGRAADFSPFTVPVLKSQIGLSAATTGRGALVPSLGIIFLAFSGAGNLLRFSTLTNTELAPLVVPGSSVLRPVVFNPTDGFLYSSNGIQIYKIDPVTGTPTVFNPGIGAHSTDSVYSPITQTVHMSAASVNAVVKVDTAGVITQSGAFAGFTCLGMSFCDVNNKIGVALNIGCGTVIPGVGTAQSVSDAKASRALSYGVTSKLCVRCAFGVLTAFNPLALTFAPLPMATPGGQLNSLAYSSLHNAHVMHESDTGNLYFISDGGATGPFGSVITTINAGLDVSGNVNDSFGIVAGSSLYVPTTNPPKMNIFS